MHHPIVLISLAAVMLDMDILVRRVEDMDWDLYNVVQLFSYLPLLGSPHAGHGYLGAEGGGHGLGPI